jgi:hypothetical protein
VIGAVGGSSEMTSGAICRTDLDGFGGGAGAIGR